MQRRQVEGYAYMHGLTLDGVVVEEGVSGSVPVSGRPKGGALFAKLVRGDVVIAPKLDRLFRSALDALRVVDDLRRRGVSLWSATGSRSASASRRPTRRRAVAISAASLRWQVPAMTAKLHVREREADWHAGVSAGGHARFLLRDVRELRLTDPRQDLRRVAADDLRGDQPLQGGPAAGIMGLMGLCSIRRSRSYGAL